jgi:hypothetical protein
MNAKYASKPNFNPNEPKLFGFVSVIPAQAGIQTSVNLGIVYLLSLWFSVQLCGKEKTNPIFLRPNMRYQYQKPGNGCEKWRQKNETNPILIKA